jgi:tRNA U34 5-carboxymethylaminomethyl modifying GTPase MnmE/TrmE
MSKINNAKLVSKYLTKADINTINDLSLAVKENDVIVTCMGLYNHGKSSLLNALIKDFDGKTFKTADTRETISNKKVTYNNFIFVDTPGLNAQKNDDKRVMDAVKQSDINIFVHNINTGEFVAKEVEFFHNIKKHWKNPQEFIERTIFVLSRVDEANSYEDIIKTANKMEEQLKDIFDVETKIIPTSSKDYVDGMLEDESELIDMSGVPFLEDNLSKLKVKFLNSIKQTKNDRLIKYYDDLIQKLNAQIQEEKLELSKLENEKKKFDSSFSKDIRKIETTLKQKYKTLGEV